MPGQDRCPADVFIPNWAVGLDAGLDVTVVNPLQSYTVAGAADTPGYALEWRFNKKMSGAAEDCLRKEYGSSQWLPRPLVDGTNGQYQKSGS